MFNVFAIIPLVLILGFSVLRNLNQKMLLPKEVIYHSFFQTIIAYLIVLIFFFQGFIFNLYVIFIIVPLMLILGLIYFFKTSDDVFYLDGILRLEAIKNNLIFTLITILPFYVFMTIFRFNHVLIQVGLSLLLTASIFTVSLVFKNRLENFFSNVANNFSSAGPIKYMIIWSVALIILLLSFFFKIPTTPMRQALNFSNSSGYYVFDGIPADVQTNFVQEEIIQLEINDWISGAWDDYFYNDLYFYLYQPNEVLILNKDTLEVEKQAFFNDAVVEEELNQQEFSSNFIVHQDYLLLNSLGAIYIVDDQDITNIKVFDKLPDYFYSSFSSDLFFLIETASKEYEIYRFNSGNIVLEETVNLQASDFDSLDVINNTLFYVKEDTATYLLYDNLSIATEYVGLFGELIYDADNLTFYIANNEGYFYNDGSGNVKLLDSFKDPAIKGLFHEGLLYYFDNEYFYGAKKSLADSRVIVINPENNEVNLYNHLETQKFIRDEDFTSRQVVGYKITDSGLEFLQRESNRYVSLIEIYKITEKPVALKLPFYSHYDIYILLWLFVGLITPITDNIKYITYIDFASMTKKKDD